MVRPTASKYGAGKKKCNRHGGNAGGAFRLHFLGSSGFFCADGGTSPFNRKYIAAAP